MIKLICSISFAWVTTLTSFSADPYPRNYSIDIQHYKFTIELNDSTNIIDGVAEVTILVKNPELNFHLDLTGKGEDGYGMKISSMMHLEKPLKYAHENDRVMVSLNSLPRRGEKIILQIRYSGIPADGLVISTNKFGDRTFFGDNWPNRAHHWIPTIDHPYDKASCEFIITAPDHYQSIANGVLIEKKSLPGKRTQAHWKEEKPIPTKVMVIGVARFATEISGEIDGIPIETWVYPQNQMQGFSDFKVATQITDYFVKNIGPFPYRKLANVQSTTRFGGMENASNIFYFENSVTGKNEHEDLIAHEIAHQWFGDAASEKDWYHVWLSEGFATYFTNLYYESAYGKDQLVDRMQKQREEVVRYYKTNPAPVIDTTLADINRVLNTNTYQKGGWFLHMLRKEVGDESFWKGIKDYYGTYQHSTAMTSDFRAIMEKASGKSLKLFFDQWLRKAGHPILSGTWTYDAKKKQVKLLLRQNQETPFFLAVDVAITDGNGATEVRVAQMGEKEAEFTYLVKKRPQAVLLDPDAWLLFEGKIQPK